MDREAWHAAVHGVTKSRTRLRDYPFTFMHWRRKWQPTPVFLPRESQGRGSLVGCRLWGRVAQSWIRLMQLSSSSSLLNIHSDFIIFFKHLFFTFYLAQLSVYISTDVEKQLICIVYPHSEGWTSTFYHFFPLHEFALHQFPRFVEILLN